ncbi:MAG: hypothetical protein AMJ54_15430 [Deltaproteobacteria bacterium SG8_13]|nr:MAG: hypothetical protein AMJ54_15430 [Deltaproteobacteria bacterium SG8_13]
MNTPGVTLKPEDILGIVSRRRWHILVPLFFAVAAGIYLAFTLPKIYEARTLILVQEQRVPSDFVRSVVTEDADARLSSISQQIMSRTTLERIIEQFNLFSGPGSDKMFLEDKIESLRKRINVEILREHRRADADAFAISFKGTDPRRVTQVANELTRYFIDTNMKVREAQASGTSDFLSGELDKIRIELNEMESALKDYRQKYMGELPEQLSSNLAILQRLQDQLTAKGDSLRDTKIALALLDKQIAEGAQTASLPENLGGDRNARNPLDSSDPEVIRKQLNDLQSRYTERHPDVQRYKKRLEELEREQTAGSGNTTGALGTGGDRKPLNPIERQRVELLGDKMDLEAEIEDLQSQLSFYQQRVENTPKREQELIALRRDYDNIRDIYNSLLNRKLEAEISVSMERKQKGEQFYVLDNAKVPEKPIAPDMRKLFLVALFAGLGLGCGLAYLLEYLDTSYRKVEEVEADLKLPVIATIPPIYLPGEVRRMRLASALSFLFAGVVSVMTGFFAVVTLKGSDQVLEILRRYISI